MRVHSQIIEEIEKLKIPSDATILDFGCGEGAFSQRLKDKGYNVISVDIDEKNFKASTQFVKLDFNSDKEVSFFIKENQNKFDLVLSIEVIEHVYNHFKFIETLKELAKPGGYILISTPNITSWLSRLCFLFYGRMHQFMENDLRYGHINPISLWQIKYIFQMFGINFLLYKRAGVLPLLYFPNFKFKTLIINSLSLLATPIIKEEGGPKYGWCIIVIGKKNA